MVVMMMVMVVRLFGRRCCGGAAFQVLKLSGCRCRRWRSIWSVVMVMMTVRTVRVMSNECSS